MKKINRKQIDTISDIDNKELRADLKELGCFILKIASIRLLLIMFISL